MKGLCVVILIMWLLLLINIALIIGDCELRIEGPSPTFIKAYGSRKLVHKVFRKSLNISQNDSLHARCNFDSNLLLSFNVRNLKRTLYDMNRSPTRDTLIRCNNENRVEFKREQDAIFMNTDNNSIIIYCNSEVIPRLFETAHLPNCEHYSNYALGVKMPEVEDIVSAGICYDLETLSLKYVNYISSEVNEKRERFAVNKLNIGQPLSITLEKKLDSLDKYFEFMSVQSFNNTMTKMRAEGSLLQEFDFDFDNILQDVFLREDSADYAYIFNMIWWRQLRLYNWNYFLEALEERSKTERYIVYVGTHANITMPAATMSGSHYEALEVVSGGARVLAPGYVWAYLHSVDPENDADAFVVIGTNSPYLQQPDSNLLCKDICDKIDWLKETKFNHFRKTATLGYTYCCQPSDIAKIIDAFPISKPKQRSTSQKAVSKVEQAPPTSHPK